MKVEDFITRRRPDWERLTTLLARARSGRAGNLAENELDEIGRLYRAVTSDLAIAQRDWPHHPAAVYLNQLVGRAHAAVYRGEPLSLRRVTRFFSAGFPRLYRQMFPFTLAAFLMFILPAVAAFSVAARDTSVAAWLGLEPQEAMMRHGELWINIPPGERPGASSFIMTNNIQVSFLAFAGGVLAGLLTVYVLVLNGLVGGGVLGLAAHYGLAGELGAFIVGHGVVELSVIFVAGGAGLSLGWAILRPGLLRRRDALALAARRSVQLIIGCIPLLVVAGTIEGFISPSALPWPVKTLVGLTSGAALYAYVGLAGRRITSPPGGLGRG